MVEIKIDVALFLVLSVYSSLAAAADGALRLVGSFSSSSGRLEIYYNGVWGTVCDDDFSSIDARVACRQLGYSGYSRYGNVGTLGYSQGTGRIWLDDVNCYSNSARLSSCSHRGWGLHDCSHNEDIALQCSNTTNTSVNNGALRLVGSSWSYRGRLEIYYNGVWGTVCDDGFSSTDARVACRQLGYSGYSRYGNVGTLGYNQGTGRIWLDDVNCYSYITRLSSCSHRGWGLHDCSHYEDIALQCSNTTNTSVNNGALRLVGSSWSYRGRLEIYYNGVWGTVCDDGFSSTDARVACRQLGYSTYIRYGNVRTFGYSQGTGRIWLDNVNCYSYSTQLSDCSHLGWGVTRSCYHSEDVALQCSITTVTLPPTSSNGALRLVGSSYSNHGRLEIYYNGVWGTVCDDGFSSNDARVACRQLGYSTYSRYGNVGQFGYSQGTGRIWLDNVNCYSYSTRLSDCSHLGWGVTRSCYHSEDVALQCSITTTTTVTLPPTSSNGALRLVGSSYSNHGRLEIYYNGVWGTVCDDGFSSNDARVACRQLGYSTYSRYGNVGQFGYSRGTGRIWLNYVNCYSHSTRLSDCSHLGWGVIRSCSHSEDVALQCSSTITSSNSGSGTSGAGLIAVGGSVGGAIGILFVFCIAGCILANGCKGSRRNSLPPPPRSRNVVTPSTNSDSPRYQLQTAPPPSYYDAQEYPPFTPGVPMDIPNDPIYTNIEGPYPADADQPPCSDYLDPATSCDACEDSAF